MPILAFILAILAVVLFLAAAFWGPPAAAAEAPIRRYPILGWLGLACLSGAFIAQFTLGGTLIHS